MLKMMRSAAPLADYSHEAPSRRSTPQDRWALRLIARKIGPAPLRFALWDDYVFPTLQTAAVATIIIRSRRALAGLLWNRDLYFGDAYMFDAIEVDGDLLAALEAVYRNVPMSSQPTWWPRSALAANDTAQAKNNVHHHYDLGNEFYRLWLDREMVYTCAYYPEPDCTLEEAQIAKMDLICRKLRLQPGERVVEAGCGWGALALYMARRFGVSVRAFNISSEQIAYARHRAARENLAGLVEFIEDDYRNVSGQYDAFVSVGMLEHVGLAHYPSLGEMIARSLTPDGRGLLHFIGRDQPAPLNRWIRRRIFPGAYPPTLREVFEQVLEPHRLSVVHVENLRMHYARTLGHWLDRFGDSSRQISQMFDEAFVRAWRLYLAGSQAAFSTGWMQLFQVVFSRPESKIEPWNHTDCERAPWTVARS